MAAEQNPQSPPASPTRESTAEPLVSDAESMQETLAALGRENSTLRSEVLRLLRVESDLSRHNASLDRQSSAYKQLAELGKRFNREISRQEIAAALVQFALYTANLQRCVVQLAQGGRFQTLAQDGYYDPDQERAVAELSLTEDDPLIRELESALHPRLRTLPTASAPAAPDATAERFFIDEYVLLPLRDEISGRLFGYLVAGSTRKKAAHHGRILPGEPLLLSLSSLVELAVVTLRSAALREALQAERAQLEARVAERTGELAEVNARLQVELQERQNGEEQRAALWQSVVKAQAARIAELSTPILPITEQILVLPLIGVMDPQRVDQLGNAVLEGAVQRRARVVILDLTGVQAPDRALAVALSKTARALGLVGVQTLLTGIGASLARILILDGTPLDTLTTSASLQAGIAQAMRIVQPGGPPSPQSRK